MKSGLLMLTLILITLGFRQGHAAEAPTPKVVGIVMPKSFGASNIPRWMGILTFGAQFENFYEDDRKSESVTFVYNNGARQEVSGTGFGYFFVSSKDAQEAISFFVENQNKQNFKVLKGPKVLPQNVGRVKNRIFILGTEWCAFCKPRAGMFGRALFGHSSVEVVYLDITDSEADPEQVPFLKAWKDSGAYREDAGFPQVIVEVDGRPLLDKERDDYLNKLLTVQKVAVSSQSIDQQARLRQDAQLIQSVLMPSMFTNAGKAEEDFITKIKPAGVLVYHHAKGAEERSSIEIKQMFDRIHKGVGRSLFVAVDQEGGNVQRIRTKESCRLPSVEILAGKTDSQIRRFAEIMARDLIRAGVNMNFAPVLDLKDNRNRDITGNQRAISEDPLEVTRVASIVNDVLLSKGILTVSKHFPGIGATVDTHGQSEIMDKSLQELKARELVPFVKIMESGQMPGMLLGHVTLSAIDPRYPIPFSRIVINDFIRKQLKYDGLIINDGFHMKASSNLIPEEEAPYRSLMAGVAPIFVNANYLLSSVRYILKQMEDPALRPKIIQALEYARTRINKARSYLKPHDDQSVEPCSADDVKFLTDLAS
ncbi:MAG: glycoside hydrolase family 3 protein [Oligoflexia bacterium]|nr:glycoside hydrolase family 3 protein [Oligoflexia bacterium]